MFKSVADSSRLPSEYQEVEWIAAEGENNYQKIRTGITPSGTAYITLRVMPLSLLVRATTFIYCGFGTSRGTWIGKPYNFGKVGFANETNGYFSQLITSNVYDILVSFAPPNGTTTAECNGETITRNNVGARETFNIFSTGSFASQCRIYSVEYSDDNTSAKFIPCYRKSDGVIGVYEINSKTFLSNSGSGTLTKGADVN